MQQVDTIARENKKRLEQWCQIQPNTAHLSPHDENVAKVMNGMLP